MAKQQQLCKEKLEALFKKHDFNQDGTIDYGEIKPILRELGFTDAVIEQYSLDLNFLAEADKDNDKKICLDEFVEIMEKVDARKQANTS